MKKYILIVSAAILLGILVIYYYNNNQKSIIECGSFLNAPCYRYACVNGKPLRMMGGKVNCSDGSDAVQGEEIKK